MAINNLQPPQKVTPVYNPVMFIYSSTTYNASSQKFQFVIDVFSAGTTTRLCDRKTIPPTTDDNIGAVYLSANLRNWVAYDFNPSLTGFSNPINSYVNFDVVAGFQELYYWGFGDNFFYTGGYVGFSGATAHTTVGGVSAFTIGDKILVEQYAGYSFSAYNGVHEIVAFPNLSSITINQQFLGSTPPEAGTIILSSELPTVFSGLNTSQSGFTATNAIIDTVDFIDYDYSDYDLKTGTTGRFYTKAYNEFSIHRNSPAVFNIISTATTNYSSLYVTVEDTLGNLERYRIKRSSTGVYGNFAQVGIGPENLAVSSASTISGSTLPIIKTGTARYTAHTENNLSARTSDDFIFVINTFCSRFPQVEILFLDSLGSWVPYTFELSARQTLNSDRSSKYTKKLGTWDTNTKSWGYNSYDRGTTIINNFRKYKYRITSNYLSFEEQLLMDELLGSSEVYWRKDGNWIPIVVTTPDNDHSLADIDADPTNIVIDFELANNSLSQING